MVFSFEKSSGDAEISWLKEGLAVELGRQLRLPQVETIDHEKRIEIVLGSDLPPGAVLSRASMIWVAQQAAADFFVMGSYREDPQGLKITANVLDLRSLRLSADIVASGPLAALPQMENELAWGIFRIVSPAGEISRETFRGRSRTVPNDAYALFIRSLSENDETEAVRLLAEAVNRQADFPEAQLRLGRTYFEQGECGKAIPQFEGARDEPGSYLQEEFMLATCYLEAGRLNEAIQAYSRINSIAPGIEALNNQGISSLRKGDYLAAAEHFLSARRLAGMDPAISLNLAILRHLEGSEAAARDILAVAAKSYPNSGMIQFVFGIVLEALGEKALSLSALEKAKSLGIEIDKLRGQDPASWTRIMPRWERP